MTGRASYRRSQERVQDIKWWDDEYNAKFNYLSYSWPGVGDFHRWYDEVNDAKEYLRTHDLTWGDVKNFSNLPGTGGAKSLYGGAVKLSRNFLDLYR